MGYLGDYKAPWERAVRMRFEEAGCGVPSF